MRGRLETRAETYHWGVFSGPDAGKTLGSVQLSLGDGDSLQLAENVAQSFSSFTTFAAESREKVGKPPLYRPRLGRGLGLQCMAVAQSKAER
jgi:hypothetical protein